MVWRGLKSAKIQCHLRACYLTALALLMGYGIFQLYYVPRIEPIKSARHAASTIQAILPQGAMIAFYGRRFDDGWNFYLNRARIPVLTDEEIKQHPQDYDMIILREKHLDKLKKVMPMSAYEIAAIEPIGSKRFVLLKKTAGGK